MQKFYLLTNSFTAWRLTMIFAQMRPLTLFNSKLTRKLNAFVKLEKGQSWSKCKQKCLIILVRPYFFLDTCVGSFGARFHSRQMTENLRNSLHKNEITESLFVQRSSTRQKENRKILFDVLVLFTFLKISWNWDVDRSVTRTEKHVIPKD